MSREHWPYDEWNWSQLREEVARLATENDLLRAALLELYEDWDGPNTPTLGAARAALALTGSTGDTSSKKH
jgi:hypothetical protein